MRLSNTFGTESLVIGTAHVALSAGGAAILPGTGRVLTFNGEAGITIPGGAAVVSDSIDLDVPPLSDLTVSLHLPEDVAATTQHSTGLQTNYISGPGDFTDGRQSGWQRNECLLLHYRRRSEGVAAGEGDRDAGRLSDGRVRIDV